MQIVELVVTASDWESAKRILAGINIHDKARTDYKEINGIFIVKLRLTENLTGQDYANIKEELDVGILKDSKSQKRAENVSKAAYKVEIQFRKLLLHVSDSIEAYYDILNDLGAYTQEFSSNSKNTITRKGSKDVLVSHLTVGELYKILEFDYSWSSRELTTSNLSQLLQSSDSFDDYKNKLAEYAKPKSVWDVINSDVLKTNISWREIEGKIRRFKKYRDMVAHHFIITEKDEREAISLCEELISDITPKRKLSSTEIHSISQSINQITQSLNRMHNAGVFSQLINQQKIATDIFASAGFQKAITDATRIDTSKFLTKIDVQSLLPKIDTGIYFRNIPTFPNIDRFNLDDTNPLTGEDRHMSEESGDDSGMPDDNSEGTTKK